MEKNFDFMTTLEQSKHLQELCLPLETADLCWVPKRPIFHVNCENNSWHPVLMPYNDAVTQFSETEKSFVCPAWSICR